MSAITVKPVNSSSFLSPSYIDLVIMWLLFFLGSAVVAFVLLIGLGGFIATLGFFSLLGLSPVAAGAVLFAGFLMLVLTVEIALKYWRQYNEMMVFEVMAKTTPGVGDQQTGVSVEKVYVALQTLPPTTPIAVSVEPPNPSSAIPAPSSQPQSLPDISAKSKLPKSKPQLLPLFRPSKLQKFLERQKISDIFPPNYSDYIPNTQRAGIRRSQSDLLPCRFAEIPESPLFKPYEIPKSPLPRSQAFYQAFY